MAKSTRGGSNNTKVKLAKQIAQKLGYSAGNYKEFLQTSSTDGYSRSKGKPYTARELKNKLKNID